MVLIYVDMYFNYQCGFWRITIISIVALSPTVTNIKLDLKMGVYATADFECVNKKGSWCSYGVMIAEYPSGKVLDFIVSYVKRPCELFDLSTVLFWQEHASIYDHIQNKARSSLLEEELRLCKFIERWISQVPDLYFISDNPQLDIRLLDNILIKHGYNPVAFRGDNIYFQCICTWSFKQAARLIIPYLHQSNKIETGSLLLPWLGPKHLPISDCARILYSHFELKKQIDTFKATSYKPTP